MRESHKILDWARLGPTILVLVHAALPSEHGELSAVHAEQWRTQLEKKKKEADLVAQVAHGDAGGYSRWCCYGE